MWNTQQPTLNDDNLLFPLKYNHYKNLTWMNRHAIAGDLTCNNLSGFTFKSMAIRGDYN